MEMSSKEKAILCASEALRFMALNLVLLDVSRFSSFADYFIICSGKSGRQVQGIADNIESELKPGESNQSGPRENEKATGS